MLHGDAVGRRDQVARQHALEDWRVRVVVGPGAHRGRGAQPRRPARQGPLPLLRGCEGRRARGRRPRAGGLARQHRLRPGDRAGAQPADGSQRRGRRPIPRTTPTAPATTLADFPLAVADMGTGNRLFHHVVLAEGRAGLPRAADRGRARPLAIDAFVASSRFDMLPEVTYHEMTRGQGVPFGTPARRDDRPSGLAGRPEGDLGHARRRRAPPRSATPWPTSSVTTGRSGSSTTPSAPPPSSGRTCAPSWSPSWTGWTRRCGRGSAPSARSRSGWSRPTGALELEELLAQRWFELGNRPTEVVDGEVRALLPLHGDAEVGVPDSLLRHVRARDRAELRAARGPLGRRRLELDLFTWISFVGMGGATPGRGRGGLRGVRPPGAARGHPVRRPRGHRRRRPPLPGLRPGRLHGPARRLSARPRRSPSSGVGRPGLRARRQPRGVAARAPGRRSGRRAPRHDHPSRRTRHRRHALRPDPRRAPRGRPPAPGDPRPPGRDPGRQPPPDGRAPREGDGQREARARHGGHDPRGRGERRGHAGRRRPGQGEADPGGRRPSGVQAQAAGGPGRGGRQPACVAAAAA